MPEMFSARADLSGLLEAKELLKVSDAVHKAFIEINEDGSEASAATGTNLFIEITFDQLNRVINFKFIHRKLLLIFINSQVNFIIFNILFIGFTITKRIGGVSGAEFYADHPFIYYIFDHNSKTTVFIGRITKFN